LIGKKEPTSSEHLQTTHFYFLMVFLYQTNKDQKQAIKESLGKTGISTSGPGRKSSLP